MFKIPEEYRDGTTFTQMYRRDLSFLDCVSQSFYFLGFNESWTQDLQQRTFYSGVLIHDIPGLIHDGLQRSTSNSNPHTEFRFDFQESD